jgi:RNA polymerase sigma-70 factor (ECF subfamily)
MQRRSGSWRAAMTRGRGPAFRLLEDREGMDDVLQEVYLKAFRALPGFRGHSAFGTWLTGSLLEQPSRRASARRDR